MVIKLLSKRWGRPCLLGEKIDTEVQTILRAMRDNGAVVNTSIAIATVISGLQARQVLTEGEWWFTRADADEKLGQIPSL